MGSKDVVLPALSAAAAAAAAALLIGLGRRRKAQQGRRLEAKMNETRRALTEAVCRGRARVVVAVVGEGETSSNEPPNIGAFFKKLQKTLSVKAKDQSPAGHTVERLSIVSELDSRQGKVPLLIYSRAGTAPAPAVIVIHATGESKEDTSSHLEKYADMGFVAVGMDCRYHGARSVESNSREGYENALVRAWQGSGERPFLLDNVWDLLHVVDYLNSREDVDAARIGLTGISLGGMITWLAAAIDPRVAAAAPLIGVQGFRWALKNNQWLARVQSIPKVFEQARQDAGKKEVDAPLVQEVWKRIAPGLLDKYDSPRSLPLIAPRPLLVINGEEDPRCPIGSLTPAVNAARKRYEAMGARHNFEVYLQTGCGHRTTSEMHDATYKFLAEHLAPQTPPAARPT